MANQRNKQIKQLDAAVRLVLGGRKKASVIVSQDGTMYSTGLDASAPAGGLLPKGVYLGEELLGVYAVMKHGGDVKLTSDQDGAGNWRVVIYDPADANARVHIAWQDCAEVAAKVPPTFWKVSKDQLKMLDGAYTLASTMDKLMLRIVRLQPAFGVLSFLSPNIVAQWWDAAWAGEGPAALEVDVDAVRRALLYRGAKLIAIGESDGKVNFAFDDGAFLRVPKWTDKSYDDTQLGRVFTFDEGSYAWPLGPEQPAQTLLEMIAKGSKVSETAGATFRPIKGEADGEVQMPLACAAGKFYPKVINQLAVWATHIQPSGPEAYWDNARIAFYGAGYRGVTSMSYSPAEADARGLTEDGSE